MADNLDGMSTKMEKLLKQISQFDALTGSIEKHVSTISKSLSATNVAGLNNIKTAGGGGGSTTSMGMASASFGDGDPKAGTNWKGLGLGALSAGLAVGKFAWDATPGTADAYTQRNMLFQSGQFSAGAFDYRAEHGRINAAFGMTNTSTLDREAAAGLLAARGLPSTNAGFSQVAGEAGFMSRMTGMSNVASAAGSISMQSGAGVSGRLMQYGIFTNDLATGNYKGMGDVIDQLWERWYGSKSAKVPMPVFQADLLGGFLGQDLRNLFGDQPELYNQIVYGLNLKAKAGGMAGINYSETARGSKSAKVVAKRVGMDPVDTDNNPMSKQMEYMSQLSNTLNASSQPLIEGFKAATDTLIWYNEGLEKLGREQNAVYEEFLRTKGFLETLNSTSEGGAGFGLALAGAVLALRGLTGLVGDVAKRVRGGGDPAKGTGTGKPVPGGSPAKPASGDPAAKPTAGRPWRVGPPQAAETPTTARATAAPAPEGGSGAKGFSGVKSAIKGSVLVTAAAIVAQWLMPEGDAKNALFGDPVGTKTVLPDGTSMDRTGEGTWQRDTITGPDGKKYRFGEDGKLAPIEDTSGGNGATNDLNRGANTAVNWAANSAGEDGTRWPGKCDRFVANAYGMEHSNYQSAKVHWSGIPERYKHAKETNAPVGALVFWSNGKDGHTAIVTGNKDGEPIITTTHTQGGLPVEMPLSEVTRQLGGEGVYSGWSLPYFHGRTASIDGVTAAASGDPSQEGPEPKSPYGTPTLPDIVKQDAEMLASPMKYAMGTSSTTVFGSNYRSLNAMDSSAAEGENTTKKSTTELGKAGPAEMSGGGKKGKRALLKWLYNAGFRGEKLREAWAIGMRESSGRPEAYNPNRSTGDNSFGLFQINMIDSLGPARDAKFRKYVKGYSGYESLLDPQVNVRAMRYMSDHGENWASWRSPQYGKAAEYYDEFPAIARKAGLPGYSQGIINVPGDQVAQLHAGNMVIPSDVGSDFRQIIRDMRNTSGQKVEINLYIEKASDEEAERFANTVMRRIEEKNRNERVRSR